MEVKNAILGRRSIRKYSDEVVSLDVLEEGILMATKAPSAHNRQPWKFKILSKEEKDKVANLLYDKTKDIKGHTGPHTASVILECPYLIMIFIDNEEGTLEDKEMDMLSIGAAIENMILYFTSMNLGTLWIGNTNLVSKEISEYLKINLRTVSCLGVGIKNQDPHERPRKNFEDILL